MPSRQSGRNAGGAWRAALLITCCFAAGALAQAPNLESLARADVRQREAALVALRDGSGGDAALLALATQLITEADARRDSGRPPLFAGCLRADEFELRTQLDLALASADGRAYQALAGEYRRLTNMLRSALTAAQASGNWRRQFSHLGHWISDWNSAEDPAVRELLHRTLADQAIRASLSSFKGKKVYVMARPTPALRAYDEYLFNLMCTADEDNLNWLKDQVARNGWFDIRRYGRAADQAAWLMVQHADGAPAYQAYIAAVLEVKARSGETDPKNYAFLSDRVAVRAGQPQTYATQMECVNGEWLTPSVIAPESLDQRRASVGLAPYEAQLAARQRLCRTQ
jgi:hypothetical protein